ncbi:MAG: hypothetical protein M1827_003156 [Pycnora praestabilis]|nr:MAG: hypothetical protein M1827_003156 [Pycnora praestabilis]
MSTTEFSGKIATPFGGLVSQPQPFQSTFAPSPMQTSFKLDEGYSEETRSQSDSDSIMRSDSRAENRVEHGPASSNGLPDWILALSEADRSELAHSVLRSLRTSSIAAIVERLNPLLHLDPVAYLPPEITFEIFSYLEPLELLKTSVASQSWRERSLDSRLWKQLYGFEGWTWEPDEVRRFEKKYTYPDRSVERSSRTRRAETDAGQQNHKKRIPEGGLFGGGRQMDAGPLAEGETSYRGDDWIEQHGVVEADDDRSVKSPCQSADTGDGDWMKGVEYHEVVEPSALGIESPTTPEKKTLAIASQDSASAEEDEMYPSPTTSEQEATAVARYLVSQTPVQPSLVLRPSLGTPKINWQYLFKQRKRLEDNWNAGRFTNFQLPHAEHTYEAHRECVYTIQYSGKYLVSGSRDRTLRIWDLDTKRLVRKPLVGHAGSVLCLQFDERKEQDIIISGSSDTDVIIWRFSTGKILKKIEHAHRESVLNLRFDDRFLITCSKDKTIKIWSRNDLLPGDKDYPVASSGGSSHAKFPAHIVSMSSFPSTALEGRLANRQKPLPPYSLLMTLDGHGAAVNAIQVYEDQVVSASGDRTVKLWNVHTGGCEMTLIGHTKGIACIQFDGRRIVTGSSDNSVRIYDRATGVEVACLQGHSNLVRTVQAGFGDLPGTEEDLQAEAKAVDRNFFEARQSGTIPNEFGKQRIRQRNAGSRNPKDITAYGAKLPPGGGGSKWGRIVSGSYDETVIIWKKDAEGRWIIGQKLRQEDAVRAAGGPMPPVPAVAVAQAALGQGSPLPQSVSGYQAVAGSNNIPSATAPAQQHSLQNNAAPLNPTNYPPPFYHPILQQGAASNVSTQQLQNVVNAHHAHNQAGNPQGGNTMGQLNPPSNSIAQQGPLPGPPQPTAAGPLPPYGHAHGHGPGHGLPHGQHAAGAAARAAAQANSRVFKLQFDSRRIICCSQDPRIVGWDFANGDEKIMEASKFFSGP